MATIADRRRPRRRNRGAVPQHDKVIRLSEDHPAVLEGRTLYPRLLRSPTEDEWVLKSGQHNRKLGDLVTKGRWKGYPIYSLSLEERATCPRSCSQWRFCYTNHMSQFRAYRYRHGAALVRELERELMILNGEPQTRRGFVVRLHAAGDFYDVPYVEKWAEWLSRFPALHVFGYSAREPDTAIGQAVFKLAHERWERFAIRQSNGKSKFRSTSVRPSSDPKPNPREALDCPAETAKPSKGVCCGSCALCWTTNKRITFIEH